MATKKPADPTVIGKDLIDRTPDGTDEGTKNSPDSETPQVTAIAVKDKPSAKKAAAKKRSPRKTTTIPDPVEPWDQRKNESGPAYEAFLEYRNLGLTRSGAKVAQKLGKSKTLIDRWSSQYSWVIRAAAYDQFLDREWVLEATERRRQVARRNADLGAKAMELVRKRVDQMANWLDVENELYDPEAPNLDVLDLRRLVDSIGKLELLALGNPTENVQVTGKDGNPLEVDLTVLPAGDLVDRLQQIRDRIDSKIASIGGDDLEATG